MSTTIDLSALSADQKRELQEQLRQQDIEERQRMEADREAYKEIVEQQVSTAYDELLELSLSMQLLKNRIFDLFSSALSMKAELYGSRDSQQSHSFTNRKRGITIKMGNRVNEGWDDTVDMGIAQVREYIKTLAKDENSANLVETVMSLISKDRKGNLKASKVLELEKLAIKTNDAGFLDGIRIIKDAYSPTASCQFIEVKIKDDKGKEQNLPLSMSAI